MLNLSGQSVRICSKELCEVLTTDEKGDRMGIVKWKDRDRFAARDSDTTTYMVTAARTNKLAMRNI